LSLPHGGYREDTIRTKAFEEYIRNNVVSWFNWAQENQLDVRNMEDLILVSGCTLVSSWAAAAFVCNTEAEVSLEIRAPSNSGKRFVWSNIEGIVGHRNSLDPVRSLSLVYPSCTVFFFGV
jgi:hypothetical protein